MKRRIAVKPEVVVDWDRWVPRLEEIEPDPKTQTTVLVRLDDLDFCGEFSWSLRKGMEWADFKFLVNSKLGRDDWEAYTDGYIWDGKMCNGRVYKPYKSQRIEVTPEGYHSQRSQETLGARTKAWQRIWKKYPHAEDWCLSGEELEEGLNNRLISDFESADSYVIVDLPINYNDGLVSLQVPKGNEWAYFTGFMDSYLGEDKWNAGFEKNGLIIPWIKASVTPRKNQLIIVRFLEEEQMPSSEGKMRVLIEPDPRDWAEYLRKIAECRKAMEQCSQDKGAPLEGESERVSEGRLVMSTKEEKCVVPYTFSELPLFQGSVHEVSLKGRTRRRITFRITLADTCHKAMGGQNVPLQSMQFGEQEPLSLNDSCLLAQTVLEEPHANLDPGITNLEDEEEDEWWIDHSGPPSDSESDDDESPEEDQTTTLVSIIEAQVATLDPVPLESIKVEAVKPLIYGRLRGELSQLEKDQFKLGRDWKERFTWDLVAREIALSWNYLRTYGTDPRKYLQCWKTLLKQGTGPILAGIKAEVEERYWSLHRKEWDAYVADIKTLRRKDRYWDCKMAYLIFYNEEIKGEEKGRRWDILDASVVDRVLCTCEALETAPVPLTWHMNDTPKLTEEMWVSVGENWDLAVEAIQDVPKRHLEKLRESHDEYWGNLKNGCLSRLTKELEDHKFESYRLGN
jgi:hypothetical protein